MYRCIYIYVTGVAATSPGLAEREREREYYTFPATQAVAGAANPSVFWKLMRSSAPELSELAIILFSISVSSASIERFWSQMGQVQTKLRNRMSSGVAVKVAKAKAAVN